MEASALSYKAGIGAGLAVPGRTAAPERSCSSGLCLDPKLVEQNLAKIHLGTQIESVFPTLT